MLLILSSSLKAFCMFAEGFYTIAKEVLCYSSLLYPELKLHLSHSCPTTNIYFFGWLFSNRSKEKSANKQEMSYCAFQREEGESDLKQQL